MADTGIIVALDGETLDSDPLAYDSRLGHLLVDLDPVMQHADVFDTSGGTAPWTMTSNAPQSREETIWSIRHNLPYIPRVQAYMFIRDADPMNASLLGYYASAFQTGGIGSKVEEIFFRVDKDYLSIKRTMSVPLITPAQSFTSSLQDWLLQVRYIINSNETAGTPYETRGSAS